MDDPKGAILNPETPPELPAGLLQDERYFVLLQSAVRKCLTYKPKF